MTFRWSRDSLIRRIPPYRYQRRLEIAALFGVFACLMLAGVSFAVDPSERVFDLLSDDLGTLVSPMFFAVWCFLNALLTPFLDTRHFRRKSPEARRYLYIIAALPIPVYTVPVGWLMIRTGAGGLSGYIFLTVFYLLVVTAMAVYRDYID